MDQTFDDAATASKAAWDVGDVNTAAYHFYESVAAAEREGKLAGGQIVHQNSDGTVTLV
jgi:hypothetical protein